MFLRNVSRAARSSSHGKEAPLAGHALERVFTAVVELDPRTGDEIFDRARLLSSWWHLPQGLEVGKPAQKKDKVRGSLTERLIGDVISAAPHVAGLWDVHGGRVLWQAEERQAPLR